MPRYKQIYVFQSRRAVNRRFRSAFARRRRRIAVAQGVQRRDPHPETARESSECRIKLRTGSAGSLAGELSTAGAPDLAMLMVARTQLRQALGQ
jgi:hypothetical protein